MKSRLSLSGPAAACIVLAAFLCGQWMCVDASCTSRASETEFAWWAGASRSCEMQELRRQESGEGETGSCGPWKRGKRSRITFKVLQLVLLEDVGAAVCDSGCGCLHESALPLQSLSCLFCKAGFSRLYQKT